jgi:hypothetical protein
VSYEALQEQGYHSSLFSEFANDSGEKLFFSTGGGFKKSSNTIGFQDQDGILGDANHFLSDSCPMVRAIGLDVGQNGFGFMWLPGSKPFLVRDPSKCHINCDEENKFYASRVTQNVPFFRNNFTVIPGLPAEPTPGAGDVDALSPPDLAAEPVVFPDNSSVEPAVEVSPVQDQAILHPWNMRF